MIYPDGETVVYAYNTNGTLKSLTSNTTVDPSTGFRQAQPTSSGQAYLNDMQYDEAGCLKLIQYDVNGSTIMRDVDGQVFDLLYDGENRLTVVSAQGVAVLPTPTPTLPATVTPTLTLTPTDTATPSETPDLSPIPSPLGEGQTDTPINQANQGEVQLTCRSIVTIGARSNPKRTEKKKILGHSVNGLKNV